jgi:chromosome segregation ATPase
MGRLYQQRC